MHHCGNGPATGEFDFRWTGCAAGLGVQSCTVEDPLDLSVALSGANAPDFTILPAEHGEVPINCTGGIFACNLVAWDPDASPVTAEVDSDTQIITIDDPVEACGDTGHWTAQYLITVPPEGLEATG